MSIYDSLVDAQISLREKYRDALLELEKIGMCDERTFRLLFAELRAWSGLSQDHCGKLFGGSSQSTVARWESGQTCPKESDRLAILRKLYDIAHRESPLVQSAKNGG